MAHLEVERKPQRPWWVWLLIILLLIALAVLIFNRYSSNGKTSSTDSISNVRLKTSTINLSDLGLDRSSMIIILPSAVVKSNS